jgi:hypothetical protein
VIGPAHQFQPRLLDYTVTQVRKAFQSERSTVQPYEKGGDLEEFTFAGYTDIRLVYIIRVLYFPPDYPLLFCFPQVTSTIPLSNSKPDKLNLSPQRDDV